MFTRKTTKGMTDVEFATEVYMGLLEIPTEYIQEVDVKMKKELSQEGYLYFEAIKTFVISKRMKEALN